MNWRVIRKVSAKPQGFVWEVEEELGQPPGDGPTRAPLRGFFKFTKAENHYWGGPAAANELIAAGLARRIGLDVAKVVPAVVEGQMGVVSIVQPAARLVTWRDLPAEVRRDVRRNVARAHQFRAMLAFDAWVLNIDRASGANIIAWQPRAGSRWRIYFIDHGHTLFGNYDRWRWGGPYRSPYWDDLWRYYGVPADLRRYLTSYDQVAPWVERIKRLRADEIRSEVRAVPRALLTGEQARLIEDLLLWRQKRLSHILRRWFQHRRST